MHAMLLAMWQAGVTRARARGVVTCLATLPTAPVWPLRSAEGWRDESAGKNSFFPSFFSLRVALVPLHRPCSLACCSHSCPLPLALSQPPRLLRRASEALLCCASALPAALRCLCASLCPRASRIRACGLLRAPCRARAAQSEPSPKPEAALPCPPACALLDCCIFS
jgi:hypothetical protein